MQPISSFDDLKVKWILFKNEGYTLFGFILYSGTDTELVEYMKNGIFDLDILSGEQCAIFVIEPPSNEWLDYSRNKNSTWWELYGKDIEQSLTRNNGSKRGSFIANIFSKKSSVKNNTNCLIYTNNGSFSPTELLDPKLNLICNRNEAIKVAKHFNVKINELPCLIFFKELTDSIIYKTALKQLSTTKEINEFFRDFFESNEFLSLVRS